MLTSAPHTTRGGLQKERCFYLMFSDPRLTAGGRSTTLHEDDAVSLRDHTLRFVRRPNILLGEFPFPGSSEEFRALAEWLARENGFMCEPYDRNRPQLDAIRFRRLPEPEHEMVI